VLTDQPFCFTVPVRLAVAAPPRGKTCLLSGGPTPYRTHEIEKLTPRPVRNGTGPRRAVGPNTADAAPLQAGGKRYGRRPTTPPGSARRIFGNASRRSRSPLPGHRSRRQNGPAVMLAAAGLRDPRLACSNSKKQAIHRRSPEGTGGTAGYVSPFQAMGAGAGCRARQVPGELRHRRAFAPIWPARGPETQAPRGTS
jgi:hypothetical protein